MKEFITVYPTDSPPWWMKINPLWWLMSGGSHSTWTAPAVNNGSPYLPSIQNQFLRNLLWWLRNPAGNFVGFIIGFEGVTFTVSGPAPVMATTPRDENPPRIGWKYSFINGWAPFVAYWGGHVEFYLGWRPYSGGFGIKFVVAS
jgi:hypothetical protein